MANINVGTVLLGVGALVAIGVLSGRSSSGGGGGGGTGQPLGDTAQATWTATQTPNPVALADAPNLLVDVVIDDPAGEFIVGSGSPLAQWLDPSGTFIGLATATVNTPGEGSTHLTQWAGIAMDVAGTWTLEVVGATTTTPTGGVSLARVPVEVV